MIEIYRGVQAEISPHLAAHHARVARPVWLYREDRTLPSWQGLLWLIESVRDWEGDRVVDEILAEHRAIYAFADSRTAALLSPSEHEEHTYLSARPGAHLTHNWYLQTPLFTAWAKLLLALTKQAKPTLFLPNSDGIDAASLAALRTLYRSFGDSAPDLVLGHATDRRTVVLDNDGLLWENDNNRRDRSLSLFYMDTDVRVVPVTEARPGKTSEPPDAQRTCHEENHAEVLAERLLEAGPLDPPNRTRVVAAVEGAFRGFSFTRALVLGRALLDNGQLSGREAATVHGIIGLTAHNRQFSSKGNLPLADYLIHHFETALNHETRPAMRCALCYRLAVAYGRRKKELAPARKWAEQGLLEAATPGLAPSQAHYQRAWLHNIVAYLASQSRNLEESVAICETAYAQITGLETDPSPEQGITGAWARDFAKSASVLSANLVMLTTMQQDQQAYGKWVARAGSHAAGRPGMDKTETSLWMTFHRDSLNLVEALVWAERGIAYARTHREPYIAFTFHVDAADLTYRLGRLDEATAHLEDAARLRTLLGKPAGLVIPLRMVVRTCLRRGEFERIHAMLEPQLERGDVQAGILAEWAATLGLSAALQDRAEDAERWCERAIDTAVAHGDRGAMLRVALLAATACEALDRPEQAREAYEQALALCVPMGPQQAPPPPGDALTALIDYQVLTGYDAALTRRGLSLLTRACEVPEPWWRLAQFLPMARTLVAAQPDSQIQTELDLLCRLTGQRTDQPA